MDIRWPERIKIPDLDTIQEFLQAMANRLVQGHCRYGPPNRKKNYQTRLEMELKAYRKTGNREHLYNIANYALLESMAPEHPKAHYDGSVGSATRKRLGL